MLNCILCEKPITSDDHTVLRRAWVERHCPDRPSLIQVPPLEPTAHLSCIKDPTGLREEPVARWMYHKAIEHDRQIRDLRLVVGMLISAFDELPADVCPQFQDELAHLTETYGEVWKT